MKKVKYLFLDLLIILLSILAAIAILSARYLPTFIIVALLIVYSVVAVMFISIRSMIVKAILCIALVVVVFSTLYFNNVSGRLVKFVRFETTIVSFYSMKDSGITKIEDAVGMKFGYSSNLDDGTVSFIRTELGKRINGYSLVESAEDIRNLTNLKKGEIDVLILNNAMHQNLLEMETQTVESLVLIGAFEMDTAKDDIAKVVDVAHEPFLLLISGNDIAGPINVRSRSDVDILMAINPTTKKVLTISIPRDTYVSLGCRTGGMDKLTDSGIYGVSCTVKTLEKLIGININYYVRVNFTSLINLVDVIGDIDVFSKYAFDTVGFHFKVGMNRLDADQALAFSRERKAFATGDIQRGLNQQEVIKAIIKKMTMPASVLKIEGILKALNDSVDTNLTSDDLAKLIRLQLDTNAKWEIKSSNLSGSGDMLPTYSMGSRLLFVMHPSQSSLNLIRTNIENIMKTSE